MARRILIADHTVNDRIAFKAALSAARYEASAVSSAEEALTALEETGTDLLMIDGALPDLVGSGLLDRLRSRDPMAPPCIVITPEDTTQTRAAWIEAGATAVIARPVERPWLLTNLRGILRRHESRIELARQVATAHRLGFAEDTTGFAVAPKLSIVGEDRAAAGKLVRGLAVQVGHPIATRSPTQVLAEAAAGVELDLIVLMEEDLEDTLWLLSELRAHPSTRRASILIECAPDDRQRGSRALDLGANALLRTDAGLRERTALIARELSSKHQSDALRRQLDQSLRLAARDDLTGLFNRRYAMQYLSDTAQRAASQGRSYGVLVVDIDHFKQVNDQLGHAAGDAVLQRVAVQLRDNLREHDLVARFGGEEFLVILSSATPGEALLAAERLRQTIDIGSGEADAVTISLGVASSSSLDVEQTIAQADAALYRAKRDGRNLSRLACKEDVRNRPARAVGATLEKPHDPARVTG